MTVEETYVTKALSIHTVKINPITSDMYIKLIYYVQEKELIHRIEQKERAC